MIPCDLEQNMIDILFDCSVPVRLFFEAVFELRAGAAAELHQFIDIHFVSLIAYFLAQTHDEIRFPFLRAVRVGGNMAQEGVKMGFDDFFPRIGECGGRRFAADDFPDCLQMIFCDVVIDLQFRHGGRKDEFERIIFHVFAIGDEMMDGFRRNQPVMAGKKSDVFFLRFCRETRR